MFECPQMMRRWEAAKTASGERIPKATARVITAA